MPETLSWARIESRLDGTTPWTLPMGGGRGVRIGYDPGTRRLYLRMPADAEASLPATAYDALALDIRMDGTERVLEVSTASKELFREFHRFASLLTENFEDPAQNALGAFAMAVEGWRAFASSRAILTAEQQLGLLGELLLLEALVNHHGPASIGAWISRESAIPERHDFRLGQTDLEVKTSRSTRRAHLIHGLDQLNPAPGHRLYILSLLVEPAGIAGGRSLEGQVARARQQFGHGVHRDAFERKLGLALYDDLDAPLYADRFILADDPHVVPVDENCPRLTRAELAKCLPDTLGRRIDQVSYRIQLDGIGAPQGASAFAMALGAITIGTE